MTADESARIDGLTGNTTSVLRTLVLSDLVLDVLGGEVNELSWIFTLDEG